jgi:hypothetical protein
MLPHLDPAFCPDDPRLAGRDLMADALQGIGRLLLAGRALGRLGAVDEMALALARLGELLDRFAVSLFAAAMTGWELDAVLLAPLADLRARKKGETRRRCPLHLTRLQVKPSAPPRGRGAAPRARGRGAAMGLCGS